MRRARALAACACACAALAAGCGSGSHAASTTATGTGAAKPPPPAGGSPAALTVTYYPRGQRLPGARTWRLRCTPPGGTHPAATAACRELASGLALLRPVQRPCVRAAARLDAPEAMVSGRAGGEGIERLVRPVCDPTAWRELHALLTGR